MSTFNTVKHVLPQQSDRRLIRQMLWRGAVQTEANRR
jgi:hypothetical protein